jgi:hypothetical protein
LYSLGLWGVFSQTKKTNGISRHGTHVVREETYLVAPVLDVDGGVKRQKHDAKCDKKYSGPFHRLFDPIDGDKVDENQHIKH